MIVSDNGTELTFTPGAGRIVRDKDTWRFVPLD
jgi:hypothetical protein